MIEHVAVLASSSTEALSGSRKQMVTVMVSQKPLVNGAEH